MLPRQKYLVAGGSFQLLWGLVVAQHTSCSAMGPHVCSGRWEMPPRGPSEHHSFGLHSLEKKVPLSLVDIGDGEFALKAAKLTQLLEAQDKAKPLTEKVCHAVSPYMPSDVTQRCHQARSLGACVAL